MARIERLDVITGPHLDTRRLDFVGMFGEQNPAFVCVGQHRQVRPAHHGA